MSREKVEVVRRVFDAVNRGDIEAALEPSADDCVLDWSNSIGPEQGVYRGKDRVREFSTSIGEAFEEIHWDPEEIIEVDRSRVIVVNHVRMRGRGSGIEVDAVGPQLWTIIGGKVRSIKLYQSRADALEAAGLRE